MNQVPKNMRYQLTLSQTMLAVAVCGLYFACIVYGGLFAGVFIGAVAGGALFVFGLQRGIALFAVTGALVGTVCMALLDIGGIVSWGQGSTSVPYTIRVVNMSDQPVHGANVHVHSATMGASSPLVGTTDAAGTVTLHCNFHTSSRTSLFINETQVDVPPDVWIYVDAAGYEPVQVPLRYFIGTSDHWHALPLPPATVQLRSLSE